MREYVLYLKEEQHTWKAYVTPCFQVDRLFWKQQDGKRLHIIGSSKSLSLVFALREEINRDVSRLWLDEEGIAAVEKRAAAFVRQVNKLYQREGERVGLYPRRRSAFGRDAPDPPPFAFGKEGVREHPDAEEIGRAAEAADRLHAVLAGRSLLWSEAERLTRLKAGDSVWAEPVVQWLVLAGKAEWRPAVSMDVRQVWGRSRLAFCCQRCGTASGVQLTLCQTCCQGCAYCVSCLDMGRCKCCTPLLRSESLPVQRTEASTARLSWSGKFSPLQARAAEKARQFVKEKGQTRQELLIWAVCGAGKTELVFPAIQETLRGGGRVLVATPRKDVVLELAPRIQAVFPHARVRAVHGASEEKWEEGDIIISTTHQVLRLYRRFQLVIVDEVDAFPFHGNPTLYRAVELAALPEGKRLYLTATPPQYLRKRLAEQRSCIPFLRCEGRLRLETETHVLVPQRYHGHPLPVPRLIVLPGLLRQINRMQPIYRLLSSIRHSLAASRQVFVFVPRIDEIRLHLRYLKRHIPLFADVMSGVFAADPQREEKVRAFRERKLRLLVTTTILERGVTIPASDVYIVGADAPVFDDASLVQMAGRVGRSADCPDGTVLFVARHRTKAISSAIRQIAAMNRLAASLAKKGGGRL